ncbi:MAG: CoA ester lyase [Deltaproteobacteria bacterium]|nr:CoA ester lyase [Deltaproteobacteria bacterium]
MSRLRRSLLFVPASSEKFFAKAKDSQADTLIFDLEDAVAPERKPAARETMKEVLRDSGFARFERTVRINALDTPYFLDDVLAMVEAGADGLVVPKTNSADSILFVERLVALAEQRAGRAAGSVVLLPLIEQPEAIGNAFAIARATPRIAGIAFGHGDFSLSMGIKAAPSTEGVVFHARCQVAMAAKAAGITPIDNVFLDIPNVEGLVGETRQGKHLGYEGKACIHPSQVDPVNTVYTPTPEEVTYARELVAAFEQAVAEGKGAVAFRGRMIDGPIADIERIVLARASKAGKS